MSDPLAYFANQVPGHGGIQTAEVAAPALGVTLQLLNVFLLLAAVGVVCSFSGDPATVKTYLAVVALADYGHIYAAYRAVGEDVFFNPSLWNDMLWGGIGVSAFLNVVRWLTVLGAFGPVAVRDAGEKERKEK